MDLIEYRLFQLVVSSEQLFNSHGTEFMCFNQDYFCNRRGLLTILVCLNVLPKLRHDCAELQMELAKVAIRLELRAELIMGLLRLCGTFIVHSV